MDNFQLLLHMAGEDVLVLGARGEIDIATVGQVKEAATLAISSRDYRCLVVDLTRVTFIDSSGLHALTDLHNQMKAAGGEFRVVNANPNAAKLFELTGLDRLLTIVPDRASALALVA